MSNGRRHRPHQVRHRIQRRIQEHHHLQLRLRMLPRPRARNGGRRASAKTSPSTNITMRDIVNAPFFFRLGARLRGPKPQTVVGTMQRIIISNVVSSNATQLPSIIAGVTDHPIEDLKISDVYLHQVGGAGADMAAIQPQENADKYPEPTMFGDLPATGIFARHAQQYRNHQCRNRHRKRRRTSRLLPRRRQRRRLLPDQVAAASAVRSVSTQECSEFPPLRLSSLRRFQRSSRR